jgi:hypothetical protein
VQLAEEQRTVVRSLLLVVAPGVLPVLALVLPQLTLPESAPLESCCPRQLPAALSFRISRSSDRLTEDDEH